MNRIKLLIFFLFLFPFFFFGFKIYLQPIAIVVPHHDFVKEQRLIFLRQISQKRLLTKRIIILSPDHFSFNQLSLTYANTNWRSIEFAQDFEAKLSQNLSLKNNIVEKDHGILNLIPDIQKVWPKAKIFPILIGQNYPISGLEKLVDNISHTCKFNCLLISSVDFSHYLPASFADVHDQSTIYNLSIQNITNFKNLEVDSPQSLYVLSKFSQQKMATNWDLFFHSNSGSLVNNYDVETTSHVLGSYQRSFLKNQSSKITTYLIAKNINQNDSLSSLGPRFFYGTDYFDLNYSEKSKILLPFDLPKNTVIMAIENNSQTEYRIFPIKTINNQSYFLRGEEKLTNLKLIKNQIKLTPQCYYQDNQKIICNN